MAIPPYGSLDQEAYDQMGLRVGLEVHQQVLTEHKLFCRCPARRYSSDYDAEILRHMRPTLSELGEYDGTALMEFKTKKNIVYRLHRETVCTYEMDDAPPFGLDDEALGQALVIALVLGCNIVGELHISRKQYLDGSIPTGFQRTTIIGTDGHLMVDGQRIGVRQLALEEDACREVSDDGHLRTYLTDRLSTPLIEVVTEPELLSPEMAAAGVEVIRKLNRSTGTVRRGYGAARQDVNVSINGGTRIEIKGVARIPLIPALVHFEALRQDALLRLKASLEAQGLHADSFKPRLRDVTRSTRRITFPPLKRALAEGARVRAVVLPGFGEALSFITQPGRPFAAEVSDRVRVIACLDHMPNLIYRHMVEPSLDPSIWSRIARVVKAGEQDGLVLTWGSAEDVDTAASEIVIRCQEALVGIPSETRQVLGDGTAGMTGFERILPGPDRMYPDTDLPPIALTDERVEAAKLRADAPPWILADRYRQSGVPEQLLDMLIVSPHRPLFERLLADLPGANPTLLAELLTARLRGLHRRAGIAIELLTSEQLLDVATALVQGHIFRESVGTILSFLTLNRDATVKDAVETLNLAPLDEAQVRAKVEAMVEGVGDTVVPDAHKRWRFLMGTIMREIRGRFPGRDVATLLNDVSSEN